MNKKPNNGIADAFKRSDKNDTSGVAQRIKDEYAAKRAAKMSTRERAALIKTTKNPELRKVLEKADAEYREMLAHHKRVLKHIAEEYLPKLSNAEFDAFYKTHMAEFEKSKNMAAGGKVSSRRANSMELVLEHHANQRRYARGGIVAFERGGSVDAVIDKIIDDDEKYIYGGDGTPVPVSMDNMGSDVRMGPPVQSNETNADNFTQLVNAFSDPNAGQNTTQLGSELAGPASDLTPKPKANQGKVNQGKTRTNTTTTNTTTGPRVEPKPKFGSRADIEARVAQYENLGKEEEGVYNPTPEQEKADELKRQEGVKRGYKEYQEFVAPYEERIKQLTQQRIDKNEDRLNEKRLSALRAETAFKMMPYFAKPGQTFWTSLGQAAQEVAGYSSEVRRIQDSMDETRLAIQENQAQQDLARAQGNWKLTRDLQKEQRDLQKELKDRRVSFIKTKKDNAKNILDTAEDVYKADQSVVRSEIAANAKGNKSGSGSGGAYKETAEDKRDKALLSSANGEVNNLEKKDTTLMNPKEKADHATALKNARANRDAIRQRLEGRSGGGSQQQPNSGGNNNKPPAAAAPTKAELDQAREFIRKNPNNPDAIAIKKKFNL